MALENIQNYLIGIIVFVLIISGGVYIVGDFYLADSSIDTENSIGNFSASMNKANEVTTSVNEIKDSIDAEPGILGWLNALIGSAFQGLKAMFGTLSFMNVVADDAATFFGIPLFLVTLVSLITVVIIAFAIWSAIMRV